MLGSGTAACTLPEEVVEEADCLQRCMEGAECATLSALL